MSWFAFVLPGKRTKSLDTKDFIDMTAEKLSEVLGVKEGDLLFIRTPTFKQVLPGCSLPLQEFSQLTTSKKYVNYERPDFYLFAKPAAETFILSISVTVENSSPTEIPPFFVDFDMNEFQNKKGADIATKVIDSLALPVNTAKVLFKGQDVNELESAANAIYEAKETGFLMRVEFTEKAISQIKKRTYVVQEIIQTEENYVHDLHIILDVWEANIKKSGIMKAEAINVVFKDIPAIHIAQNAFLTDLKSTGSDYKAQVANLFLEFAPAFKYSQHYVSNYPAIVDVLTHYEQKPKYMKKMRELQDEGCGRDLHSFLITPVQRMPRYILFLRDLLKCTPSSHPDFELLGYAYDEILSVTQQFDKTTATAKTQAVLMRLQQSITNGFVFLETRRELLMQCNVSFCDSKGGKGQIYLFNDLIMLVGEGTKGSKVLFDSGVTVFRFRNQWPTMDSFSVEAIGKSYIKKRRLVSKFSFLDPAEEDSFFLELSRLQDHAVLKSTARFTIRWDNIDMATTIFPFVKPKAVCLSDSFFVFSGSSAIDVYMVKNDDMVHSHTLPPHVKQISVCLVDRYVYIWSYETLYKYDPVAKTINAIQLDLKIKQRKGVSLVNIGTHLIMFGGKSTTGSEYYSNVYFIDLETNHAEEVECEGERPSARWNHAAVVVDGKMIICGGSGSGKVHDDAFVMDPSMKTWTRAPFSIGQRKRHSVLLLGSLFLVVVGGIGEGGTKVIDYYTSQEVVVDQFGNVDTAEYSSSVVTADAAYVIAGTRDKKTQFSSVYVLNTPPTLRPISEDQRNAHGGDHSTPEPIGDSRKKGGRKRIKSVNEKRHHKGKRSKQSPKRQYLADMASEIPKQEPVVTPEVNKKSLEKVRRLSLITTDESDETNFESFSSFHISPSPENPEESAGRAPEPSSVCVPEPQPVPKPASEPQPKPKPAPEPKPAPKPIEVAPSHRQVEEHVDKYGINDTPLLESYDLVETERRPRKKFACWKIVLIVFLVLALIGGGVGAGIAFAK